MNFGSLPPKSPGHNRSPSQVSGRSPLSSKRSHDSNGPQDYNEELLVLQDKKEILQARIARVQTRLTQYKQSDKTRNQKEYSKKIINEFVVVTEESFEIRRSIKEINNMHTLNEANLSKLRAQLKAPQLGSAQRLDINKRIQTLLKEVKKTKEIKDNLENVYKKNEQQRLELKEVLCVATVEDNFSFVLESEHKYLQLENENLKLKVQNLHTGREKDLKLKEMKKELDVQKQRVQEMMHKLTELEKSRNSSISRAYRNVSKDSTPDEESRTFLTPKTANKYQSTANKTTGGKKKSKTATTFRFIAADFPAKRPSAPTEPENRLSAKNTSTSIKSKTQTTEHSLNQSRLHNISQGSSNITSPKNSFTTRVLDIHLTENMESSGHSSSIPTPPLKSTRNLNSSEVSKDVPSTEKTEFGSFSRTAKPREDSYSATMQAAKPLNCEPRYDFLSPKMNFGAKAETSKTNSITKPSNQLSFQSSGLHEVERPSIGAVNIMSKESGTYQIENISNIETKMNTEEGKSSSFGKSSTGHNLMTYNKFNNASSFGSSWLNASSGVGYNQAEESIFGNDRDSYKSETTKFNVQQSPKEKRKFDDDKDDDTCLIGSLSQQRFSSQKKKIPFGECLKDITNNYGSAGSSSKKRTGSNKKLEGSFGGSYPVVSNFQRFLESERKNPLDMILED